MSVKAPSAGVSETRARVIVLSGAEPTSRLHCVRPTRAPSPLLHRAPWCLYRVPRAARLALGGQSARARRGAVGSILQHHQTGGELTRVQTVQ